MSVKAPLQSSQGRNFSLQRVGRGVRSSSKHWFFRFSIARNNRTYWFSSASAIKLSGKTGDPLSSQIKGSRAWQVTSRLLVHRDFEFQSDWLEIISRMNRQLVSPDESDPFADGLTSLVAFTATLPRPIHGPSVRLIQGERVSLSVRSSGHAPWSIESAKRTITKQHCEVHHRRESREDVLVERLFRDVGRVRKQPGYERRIMEP